MNAIEVINIQFGASCSISQCGIFEISDIRDY